MSLEDMMNRAVNILYDNFSQVATRPQLTRELKKNMGKAKRRNKVHLAKMWIRYLEKKQHQLMEEQKQRNGWDKDPIFVQINRAAVMMPFSKISVEEMFPNSMYAYYKKIVQEDEARKAKEKFAVNMQRLAQMNGEEYNPNDYGT